MSRSEPTPYDAVDYPGHPFADTHPARTGAIGVVRGLDPAPIRHCRVLELGCGDGANLIPMAHALPDATFVGIDLARRAIHRGRAAADELGLRNVALHAIDLMDAPQDLGTFDYIIAHGLYSWVPDPVRERILELCGRHLAPHGIAFVSYLALPGNRSRDMLRDFLFAFGAGCGTPQERVHRARQLMRNFADAPESAEPIHALARSIAIEFGELDDGVIFHDWLAPINDAFTITDFARRAARHSLRFLGEAQHFMTRWEHDPRLAPARHELERLEGDDVAREQLLDYLRCRRFRESLLCRDDVALTPPAPDRVHALVARSTLRPDGVDDDGNARFLSPRGATLSIRHPVLDAALRILADHAPAFLPVARLLDEARSAAGRTAAHPAGRDADALGGLLLACWGAAHAELIMPGLPAADSPGPTPRASALARLEITRGPVVTSLRHQIVRVDDAIGAALLGLLDGTRDRDALVRDLVALVEAGRIPAPPGDGTDLRASIGRGLDASLQSLARTGLLEA